MFLLKLKRRTRLRKSLCFAVFGLFFLFTSYVNAGHDFMERLLKASTLIKEESCSNGKTKIERRLIMDRKLSLVVIIIEPNADYKKSQFYSEDNKDFYSLIFYNIFNDKAPGSTHLVKNAQSGDLQELDFPQWLEELNKADSNAAKSVTNKLGSDCKTTYQAPKR